MKRTVFGWGPVVLWAGVLFLLSEWEDPGSSVLGLLELPDEILHIVIYMVLGAALWWARHHRHPGVSALWFGALGWAYGMGDEWHQSFVVGRDSTFGDVVSDWIGVLLGLGALMIMERRSRQRMERSAAWSDQNSE